LISFHFISCSSLHIHQAKQGISVEEVGYFHHSRKFLAYKSASIDLDHKASNEAALKEPKKALDSSLRKRPRSGANPTQN